MKLALPGKLGTILVGEGHTGGLKTQYIEFNPTPSNLVQNDVSLKKI